ncbi:VOC family protein [Dongia sp. agr-C8]
MSKTRAVKKVGHVVLNVRDPEASARWYKDVLGMIETARGEGGIFLSFGEQDHDIALFSAPPGAQPSKLGLQHVGMEIEGGAEELRAHYAHLLANDVKITEIADHGIAWGVYFLDLDGNELEVFARLAHGEQARRLLHDLNAPARPITIESIAPK